MFKFARIAWRNVWRNKRRSLLTLGMLTAGLALFIFAWSFGDAFHDEMIRNTVQTQMGDIEVHRQGFVGNPLLKTRIAAPRGPEALVAGAAGVAASAPRLKAQALASTAYSSSNVALLGIDPRREKELTVIQARLVRGTYLASAEGRQAMIGAKLAQKLKLGVGDKIIVMGQSLQGEIKADALKIVGIYYTSDESLDRYSLYLPIREAQSFFGVGDAISEIAVRVRDESLTDAVVRELQARLNDPGLEVLSWRQVDPGLVQFIIVDNWGLYIMVFVVAVMIGLEVYNTMLMSILERTREFGIMLALGTRPGQVVLIVLWEAAFLGMLMVGLGGALGGLATLYFVFHPMDFSFVGSGMEMFSIAKTVPFTLGWWRIAYSALIMLALVGIAVVWPARKAAGLKPAEAVRSE